MFAFPVKMDKENTTLAPLFGKAKYFAFYDGKEVLIERNECNEGENVALWLKTQGVNKLIIKEMGSNAYKKCIELNFEIFSVKPQGSIEIPQICEAISDNKITIIDKDTMSEIIKKHEKNHNHHNHNSK